MRSFLLIAVTLFLTACSYNYSISEAELNQRLQRAELSKQVGIPGLALAAFKLTDLELALQEQDQKLQLDSQLSINVQTSDQQLQAQMRSTLEARPDYQPEQGAIYLKDLRILNQEISPSDAEPMLRLITPLVELALNQYLERYPLYQLDESDSKQAMAKRLGKDVQIKANRIDFVFGY
ncbi:DUF1439 domain-containing protein [Aliagarivorans taiwanensis]|uniref:DUF1439 domain-containing protein n=1 Tax=Aliagarivorans taiwanensis TaxID=561966 RepID=UPI000478F559|nr:DUF1439 domain-containing protein [Aliagarivorans taiwanensis]